MGVVGGVWWSLRRGERRSGRVKLRGLWELVGSGWRRRLEGWNVCGPESYVPRAGGEG